MTTNRPDLNPEDGVWALKCSSHSKPVSGGDLYSMAWKILKQQVAWVRVPPTLRAIGIISDIASRSKEAMAS